MAEGKKYEIWRYLQELNMYFCFKQIKAGDYKD